MLEINLGWGGRIERRQETGDSSQETVYSIQESEIRNQKSGWVCA